MRKYEIVLVFDSSLNDSQVNESASKIIDHMKSNGATEVITQNWGKRDLAYPINKKRIGNFVSLGFATENHGLPAELERVLNINEKVLRYQTVHLSDRERKVRFNPMRQNDSDFDSDDSMQGYY